MAGTGLNMMKSVSDWAEMKPASYKGTDLDKALKAYEGVDSLSLDPRKLTTIRLKELEAFIAELEKLRTSLKKRVAALKAVNAAVKKTVAELTKAAKESKTPKAEVEKYKAAITYANTLPPDADKQLKDFE